MMRFSRIVESPYLFLFTGILWWIAFFPGFFSADSFAALDQARTGEINNSYTAIWPLLIRVITFAGRIPAFGTLFCSLTLAYSVHFFARSTLTSGWRNALTALFLVSPLIGAMGITLWHDIPMTAGLLLLSGVYSEADLLRKDMTFNLWAHGVVGAFLVAFRPNGLPVELIFIVLIFAIVRSKKFAKVSLILVGVTLSASVVSTLIVGQETMINPYYAQEWMRSDLACELSTHPENVSDSIKNQLRNIAPIENWNKSNGCTFINHINLTESEAVTSTKVVPKIWREEFLTHPLDLLKIHLQRNAYLIPIPTHSALNPPFIQSNIENQNSGVSYVFPALVNTLRVIPRAWNALRPITAFSGLWFAILLAVGFWKRRNASKILPPILLCTSLELVLFVFAPIPDGRYALFVLVASQLVFADQFSSFLAKRRVKP
jgi:hypothetical protein